MRDLSSMIDLLPEIRKWFEPKREHFRVFALADCRLESWFKGELLVLLGRLREGGHVSKVRREVKLSRRSGSAIAQVDFAIDMGSESHLCELKAPCISRACTSRDLRFYFGANKIGVCEDFRKLDDVEARNKWLLAFVYPCPDQREWESTVSAIPASLRHWKSVTSPTEATPELFISLWRCTLKARSSES